MEYIDRNLCETVAEYDQYYKLVVPLEKIRKMPAADVVPVVRCRECIHRNGAPGQPNIICQQMKDDDFCSYGERSTD